ncbi:MAG TPA: DNA internalization-related competence protein ComEC/Rec2 [Steroidobacteraceae bacterium]
MSVIALAFCAGIATVHLLPALLPAPLLAAVVLLAALAVRRRPALAAYGIGVAHATLIAAHLLAAGWPCTRDREEVTVAGTIASPAVERDDRTDFDLVVTDSTAAQRLRGIVRLSWYEAPAVPQPGQLWRLTVRLRCRQGLANPGAADRELDLLRQRVVATGYVVGKAPSHLLGDQPSSRPVERLRARIAAGIAASLPAGPSVSVLQGLSVGLRGNVPDELWDAFAATGVAHLMAISGLHVTGCALFVLWLLRRCWRWPAIAGIRARVATEMIVVLAVTAGYVLLAGASLPALRTLAMVAIVALQRTLRRTLPLHRTLALAAALLCGADPLALTSAGFWLSFVATAALLAILEPGSGWLARAATFARAQAAVTALLTPVLAAVFGRVSLVSPLVNALAIPVFSFLVLPAVLFATILDITAIDASASIWRGLAALLDGVWPRLSAIAQWPASAWAPAAQPMLLLAGAGLMTLAALLLPLRGLRAAAAVLLLAIAGGAAARPRGDAWTLTVIDVGQGLAAVVETRQHVLVFDSGPRWRGGGTAARISLLPYLRARGIRRIDRLVVSHRDMDHAGGVLLLQRSLQVARTIGDLPGGTATAGTSCRRGDRWHWDGVEFLVLHPPPEMEGGENDLSCALRISGSGGSALLLADPESRGEETLLSAPVSADVVLLPHHGSRTSSGPALVEAVGARLGIASAGFGNRWGLPAAEVVARWRAAGTTVLATAATGAVTVRFSPGRRMLEVETERGGARRWWRRLAAD